MARFSFPDSIDILIAVLSEHGFTVDTQMMRDESPTAAMPSALDVANLPFVHLVNMPGEEAAYAPFATHSVQARVYSTTELTARDSARLLTDVLKAGPLDGGTAGVIDDVRATTPVMVDSGYGGRVQYNTILSCDVRAL